jgi:DNA processing protein
MGVPGPVTSAPSEGVHELIRAGKAALVTRGSHVLELVSPSGTHLVPPSRGESRPRDGLDERELRVLDALPVVHGVSVASLARTSGLSEAAVRASLALLTLAGLAEQCEGVWRLREMGRHASG